MCILLLDCKRADEANAGCLSRGAVYQEHEMTVMLR